MPFIVDVLAFFVKDIHAFYRRRPSPFIADVHARPSFLFINEPKPTFGVKVIDSVLSIIQFPSPKYRIF
jgi:hypothetical protein